MILECGKPRCGITTLDREVHIHNWADPSGETIQGPFVIFQAADGQVSTEPYTAPQHGALQPEP